jgi:hypothetical protein
VDVAELTNRVQYHPATGKTGPMHDQVRAKVLTLILELNDLLPEGRHKALAMTALEETMHWANASIACSGS